MTPIARAAKSVSLVRSSTQPIALAAALLLAVLAGVASIALWRTYTGTAPELDRVVSTNSSMHDENIFNGVTYQVWRLSDLKLLKTAYFDVGENPLGVRFQAG